MTVKKLQFFGIAIFLCFGGTALAQKPAPTPRSKPEVWIPPSVKTPAPSRDIKLTTEKFISVDPNVNIKFCVNEGALRVNGWNRNEVRVFVRSGRIPGFKVLETDSTSGKPNWLLVTNTVAEGTRPGPTPECLSGSEIEMDVPKNSTLNLTGRSAETSIDSIKKVIVKTVEGDISIRNIAGGIAAATYQGDLMVEGSGGSISLEATAGNILAYGVTMGQIGDLFKAKTGSGSISMQKVDHRQIEASTISGSVNYNGKFLPGGIYNFKTSNGSMKLQIPENSSSTIKGSYGFGSFTSEIPLKYLYQNNTGAGKNFLAIIGTGDANVAVTTNTGSIAILKQRTEAPQPIPLGHSLP